MATDLVIDLWTFDVAVAGESLEGFQEALRRCVVQSWDSGADLVLLPEFLWLALEPHVQPLDQDGALRAVAAVVWGEILPRIRHQIAAPGKAALLGTAPCETTPRGPLRNRAVFLAGRELLRQDKLHLTPWETSFTPGTELHIWEWAGLRVAILICLDVEIPELAVRLRDERIDLILCPSATESIHGVERINRCASARAVELGCYVAVAHLTGRAQSALIDHNLGRCALYGPSQADFGTAPRWLETGVFETGHHCLRATLSPQALAKMRRRRAETNPALLGKKAAGLDRDIRICHHAGLD